MPKFFINHPIFAWVVSILISLAGVISILNLGVESYPSIAPPQVTVSATYPGASAETTERSVTQVIEQQLTGIDNLLYFSSSSSSSGQASITLTFQTGTDADIAQVQVQNKVSLATPRLPSEVTAQGVVVAKANAGFLMVVGLQSENASIDRNRLNDLIASRVLDQIARVPGVGSTQQFGAEYAMNLWLDPGKLQGYNLSASEVLTAVRGHNSVFDDDVMAASSAQTQHIPVVFNTVVRLGQQKGHMLKAGRAITLGQQSAQEQPVAVLGTTGEAPAAIELEAAFHRLGLASGHIGRGNAHAAVLAPDILLRLCGEQCQLPGVNTHHAIHPGGGHAALGQFHLHGVEHAGVHLIATPALGLQHTEQTSLGHFCNGLVADGSIAIRQLRTGRQLGGQCFGSLDHGESIGGQVVIGHCVHTSLQLPLQRAAFGGWARLFAYGKECLTMQKRIHRPIRLTM